MIARENFVTASKPATHAFGMSCAEVSRVGLEPGRKYCRMGSTRKGKGAVGRWLHLEATPFFFVSGARDNEKEKKKICWGDRDRNREFRRALTEREHVRVSKSKAASRRTARKQAKQRTVKKKSKNKRTSTCKPCQLITATQTRWLQGESPTHRHRRARRGVKLRRCIAARIRLQQVPPRRSCFPSGMRRWWMSGCHGSKADVND
ncbi:hypothetical protein DFJ73DRAFT_809953 [Zopfochytrium polystomum]|nr:hypothetical protein DFJ73DRAFT_809953 [Zopfochytrium polystomum]